MAREYDSSRRRQAAERTRKDIVQAAIKLHWHGITDFAAMAEEAGCAVATVRKHFPTKEHLVRDCTQAFGETLALPDPAAIAEIEDQTERVDEAIRELLRVHESMFGYAWFGAHARSDSPTLESVMSDYESLADAIAGVVAAAAPNKVGFVRGLLDFLTYRAMRTKGGLSPEEAFAEIHGAVRRALESPTRETPRSNR